MEIEVVGRYVAGAMVGVVAAWLLTGLVQLIRDGIRFRRGMRAQLEANRLAIEMRERWERDYQPPPASSSSFPLAAPVIDRVRGMNTPVIDGFSVNNVDQYIAAQNAIDSMPVGQHGRLMWDPNDAQMKLLLRDCPCNACQGALRALERGRDNL